MISDDVYHYEIYCNTCGTMLWVGLLFNEPTAAFVESKRRDHICIGGVRK